MEPKGVTVSVGQKNELAKEKERGERRGVDDNSGWNNLLMMGESREGKSDYS